MIKSQRDTSVSVKSIESDPDTANTATFDFTNLAAMAPDATIIFNVSGAVAGLAGMSMEQLNGVSGNVLFNFVDADTLSLLNIGVWGSILAPYADVINPSGVVNGTVVANSWSGMMQQNHNPFTPRTVPTPIPGSSLLLFSGISALVALRRKKIKGQ